MSRLNVALLFVAAGLNGILIADEPASAVGPLLKLFQSGRLPAERIGTVAEMICNRGNEHDLRVIFDRIVQPDGFSPEVRLKAIGWLTESAATRKVKPSGELAGLEALVIGDMAAKNRPLQEAAIRLASTWKDVSIAPALQQLAMGAAVSPDLQRVAIEGLVAIGSPASRQTLESLVANQHPLRVRMQAASGLAGIDLPFAAQTAAAALADATPQDDSAPLLDAFLNRKQGAEQLAAALAKQKLDVDVAKRGLRYMYSVGRSDAALSNVLSAAAGIAADSPPPTQAQIAKIVMDVIAQGDAKRGERIFRRKDLNCMKCHSVNRAGGQVGPELSAVGGSSPVDYMVNSILNPNVAIKEQYATRVFVTAAGQVFTGIVVDRDEVRIRIRDANGQMVSIPAADVDEELEGPSLMPQGLTKFLTRDELLDLAKFVSDLGKPGPFAVQTARTIQRWRVLRTPPQELTSDVPHLEHVRQFVLGSQPTDWDAAYGQVSGHLPLDELRADHRPVVVILQGELHATAAGVVTVQIDCSEKLQAWFDAESIESRSPFEVTLSPGRHVLTLRVEVSAKESPLLRVEFTTSRDSGANFEIVGGM